MILSDGTATPNTTAVSREDSGRASFVRGQFDAEVSNADMVFTVVGIESKRNKEGRKDVGAIHATL